MEYVTDLYGNRIEVADLIAAIEQAELFSGFQHENQTETVVAHDEERRSYYSDLLVKLKNLKDHGQ